MSKRCVICNQEIRPQAMFCGKCGAPLDVLNRTPEEIAVFRERAKKMGYPVKLDSAKKPRRPRKPGTDAPKTPKGTKISKGSQIREDSYLKELDDMIGLESVKREVRNRVNMIRLSQKAVEVGSKRVFTTGTLHMVFTGNPGTGKTTVARLVGKIYEALGLVSDSSIFVECGRSDLIGQYIGQTAPKVDHVVKSALGGILFIDEAYSLYTQSSSNSGDFGREAISELVKEMENHRDNLIVIMAGYSQDMRNMIDNANAGLKSRFPVWLDFEDYTVQEMAEIFWNMLNQKGYHLAGAPETLVTLIEKASAEPDFGNGRGVRNLVDKVITAQSMRLSEIGYRNIHDSNVYTEIESEDLNTVLEQV